MASVPAGSFIIGVQATNPQRQATRATARLTRARLTVTAIMGQHRVRLCFRGVDVDGPADLAV